jgi:murein L,D-transpeptidase YafK
MQFRLIGPILAAFVLFVPLIGEVNAANETWHPESVSAREAGLSREFEARGLKLGSPVFIRVYKQTSEMELWVQQGPRFALYKTYGICRWSGGLGPKFYEGDRQSPEGLYRITSADLIVNARWDRAMNINYPNAFDVLNGRSGSSILIHGKCGSIGCFAIQDKNVEEVYGAVRAALHDGQAYVPVLSLPFRFTSLTPSKEDTLHLNDFWTDLRRADLLFERDKLPPIAYICDGRYYFADRRGDSHRHAVHMPGCKLLDDRWVGPRDAISSPANEKPVLSVSSETPNEAVENEARNCNGRTLKCRLLRVAIKSAATCPTKYLRCRTAKAAFTKSVDCPLKYPRCRFFVGPEPRTAKPSLKRIRHVPHEKRGRRAV